MGTFALNIGYALIGVAAVVAVWIVWMKRRAPKPRPWLGLPRELEALRTDFEESIDGAHAEAQRATKIGETFVAALKPIDQAIRDFKNRITELEKRAERYVAQVPDNVVAWPASGGHAEAGEHGAAAP